MRSARLRVAVVVVSVALAAASALPAPSLAREAQQGRISGAKPSVKAPSDVIEGARFAITVSIPRTRQAARVQLQFRDQHDYEFQSTLNWSPKVTKRTSGRRQIVFHLRADEAHQA